MLPCSTEEKKIISGFGMVCFFLRKVKKYIKIESRKKRIIQRKRFKQLHNEKRRKTTSKLKIEGIKTQGKKKRTRIVNTSFKNGAVVSCDMFLLLSLKNNGSLFWVNFTSSEVGRVVSHGQFDTDIYSLLIISLLTTCLMLLQIVWTCIQTSSTTGNCPHVIVLYCIMHMC